MYLNYTIYLIICVVYLLPLNLFKLDYRVWRINKEGHSQQTMSDNKHVTGWSQSSQVFKFNQEILFLNGKGITHESLVVGLSSIGHKPAYKSSNK